MNITDFRQTIKEYLEDNHDDIRISECDVSKNNGIMLHGICFKRGGERVLPTIYLEGFLEKYNNGKNIKDIADEILEIEEKSRFTGEFDENFFSDFNLVKPKLFIRLINSAKNASLLDNVPHRHFMDLAQVVYCDVSDVCGMSATILVRNEHLKEWDVEEEELLNIAYKNTKHLGCNIKDMYYYLRNAGMNAVSNNDTDLNMFIMKNDNEAYGAVCMTYYDVLDEFLRTHSDGVYIIPSSIHEVILLPKSRDVEEDRFNSMIQAVNVETLSAEEVLADHAYYYSMQEGYRMV